MHPVLTQDSFQKTLASERYRFFTSFYYYDSVGSTNLIAKDHLKTGADADTVILAAEQLCGRGRYNRHWHSPPGGLYVSLILHPKVTKNEMTLFPLLAAVSVHCLLLEYEVKASIKWPNDVLVNNKKIAGILLEILSKDSSFHVVICGMGININNDVGSLSSKLCTPATSLKQEIGRKVDILKVTARLLHIFEEKYMSLQQQKPEMIIAQWKQASETLAKQVTITQHNRVIRGMAMDIDIDGFLLVRDVTGNIHRITSGDCQYEIDNQ